MVSCRRNFVPGGTYFFTVTLADRSATRWSQTWMCFVQGFRHCREAHRFAIVAIVVLSDRSHSVWINPMKHGYISRPVDWPYSSLHRYVRQGQLPTEAANPTSTVASDLRR